MTDYAQYHEFAVALAKEASEIARQHFSAEIAFDTKSDDTPVTIADRAINRLVIERCLAAFPEIGIIGEEESHVAGDGSLVWVCDPIDGTIPYSFGMPISTFCLALVDDGVPVVGVVYDFYQRRLLSAIRGGELLLNGDPVTPGDQPQRIVNLEWSASSEHDSRGIKEALFTEPYRVTTYVSTSYMICQVALGRMAATIYSNRYPWDLAAAKVIAEAAGCRVTDLDGNDQSYAQDINGAIVAWPGHYDGIAAIVRACGEAHSDA